MDRCMDEWLYGCDIYNTSPPPAPYKSLSNGFPCKSAHTFFFKKLIYLS